MRLLLDTHLLIWTLDGSGRLPPAAQGLIESATRVHVSAASIWECAIKIGLGKLRVDLGQLRHACTEAGFAELPVTAAHAERVLALPAVHRDPFDRLLVAQADVEPMRLLTADALLARYSSNVVVCR